MTKALGAHLRSHPQNALAVVVLGYAKQRQTPLLQCSYRLEAKWASNEPPLPFICLSARVQGDHCHRLSSHPLPQASTSLTRS